MIPTRTYLLVSLLFAIIAASWAATPEIFPQRQVVAEGEETTVMCRLSEPIDVLEKSVVFYKKQEGANPIVLSHNTMIFDGPYKGYIEVKPSRDSTGTATAFSLTIKAVQPRDSGMYGCEVKNQQGSDAAGEKVWATVFVRDMVNALEMFALFPNGSHARLPNNTLYALTDDINARLICSAGGSMPPAKVDMYRGEQRVAEEMYEENLKLVKEDTSDNNVVSVITYNTSITTKKAMVIEATEVISCVASTEGSSESLRVSITTKFTRPPVVKCDNPYAGYLSEDVWIECRVNSDPELSDIYWVVQGPNEPTNNTIRDSNVQYMVNKTMHEDGHSILYSLGVRRVYKNHLNNDYMVVATNAKGTTKTTAKLVYDPAMGAITGSSNIPVISSLLIACTALSWML